MSNHIPNHEVWYHVAMRVEARKPHASRRMLSLSSKGPLWSWTCTMPNCDNGKNTLPQRSFTPPLCHGGLPWSFTTQGSRSDC